MEFPVNFLNELQTEVKNHPGLKLGQPVAPIQGELFTLEGDSAKHALYCQLITKPNKTLLTISRSPKGDAATISMLKSGGRTSTDLEKHALSLTQQWEFRWKDDQCKWLESGKLYTNAELVQEIIQRWCA